MNHLHTASHPADCDCDVCLDAVIERTDERSERQGDLIALFRSQI